MIYKRRDKPYIYFNVYDDAQQIKLPYNTVLSIYKDNALYKTGVLVLFSGLSHYFYQNLENYDVGTYYFIPSGISSDYIVAPNVFQVISADNELGAAGLFITRVNGVLTVGIN